MVVINIKENLLENIEQPESHTAMILQRENSVNKYYIELRDNALTKQGYFDLVSVPDLYVSGAGSLLKGIRKKNDLKQKDIAKIFKVSDRAIRKWESNSTRLPLRTLVRFVESMGVSKERIYSLIDQGEISTGNLPVKFQKIQELIKYFSPIPSHRNQVSVLKCPYRVLLEIKKYFRIKRYRNELRIHSKSLHDFLTTFFRYTRICKLNPPLTNEIKNWHNNGVDLKRAIICPNLQSDGSITKRILFCGNNKILHDYFVDAMYYEYDILPTSYFLQSSNCVPSTYYELSTTKILDDILKVVGNTKTHPATGQSVKEYLEEPQPNLDYLINASKIEQLIALRIWASTEGCISIGGGKGKLRPYFMIACSHPTLISQLKKIAGRHDLHMLIKRSRKTWSGLSGIYSTSRKTLINFLKLGGFIKGVKISSRSRYHEGISKDILIVGILEYIRQRYMNKWPNELPKNVHHHNINKIIQNKEYQSAKYYIDLFS